MSINPNDPVVAMLKQLVSEYDKKLDELAGGVQEAFRMFAEGNTAALQQILTRLQAVEARVPAPTQVPEKSEVGVEL